LQITLDYCDTREKQQRAVDLLQFKLDILWTMLDSMWMAYIENRPPYCMEMDVEKYEFQE
jgi:pyrroloquinoline-quinone synthase